MADEGFKRKLAAILSADVEGYSRLMDDDEEATVRTLTSYRSAITDLVQQYRGRVVDSPGDNILAEFVSVVDSVNCAVEIQRELAERNAELPDNSKMQFRIGVNLGDVIDEDGRIYGDGVNIAARVESLAEAGGICISGRGHDQVENKLGLEYEDLGKHEVKNISRPIQVHRVLSYPGAAAHRVVQANETLGRRWRNIGISAAAIVIVAVAVGVWKLYTRSPTVDPASVEKMAYPLPDKPSIAVLPFDNMTKNHDKDYFGDGLAEDIITALSKSSEIFVVARNSTFAYKGKAANVRKVAEDLGVRFVLEGSFRIENNKVRINTQLIDAIEGYHIWGEIYDRELENIFSIQDDITKQVISSLHVQLTIGEDARILEKATTSLKAYLLYLQARELHFRFSKESNHQSRKLLEEIISIDPEYGSAYSLIAATHMVDVFIQATDSPRKSLKKAIEIATKATTYWDGSKDLLGFLYGMVGQYDRALMECKKAIELYPGSSTAHAFYGVVLNAMGRHAEAIAVLEKSVRLDPFTSSFSLRSLCFAYALAGSYDEAIDMGKKAIKKSPYDLLANFFLTLSYSFAGRIEDAKIGVKEILRINPNFYLDSFVKRLIIQDQNLKNRIKESLQSVGLPLKPMVEETEKPSIAVLPFKNMSNDSEQEYFSDGISEEIITALSKTPKLLVIARNSTFSYKAKAVNVKQIAKELGVQYILEGSVRKDEERVRITAQLIDSNTGHHVWAERYDRKLKDVFALQDEITIKIISALQVNLTEGEMARISALRTQNLEAYLKAIKAREYFMHFNERDNSLAQRLVKEAIDLDPEYPFSYALLGWTHFMDIYYRTEIPVKQSMSQAFKFAQKALSMDTSLENAYGLLAYLYLFKRQYDNAIAEAEQSVAINPNYADGYCHIARILHYVGKNEEAIELIKKALRLNPYPPTYYYYQLGYCYLITKQYEQAVIQLKKAIELEPKNQQALVCLAAVYGSLDNQEEALLANKGILTVKPKFSVENWVKKLPYKNETDNERLRNGLYKAGLPE